MHSYSLLLAALAGMLCSCAATDTRNDVLTTGGITATRSVKSEKKQLVRLTVYWARGRGSDFWTRRFRSATGGRLEEGVSIAADPNLFPYGSQLLIEGVGERQVVDTGSAVVRRTASRRWGRRVPVVDLFFERRRDALEFAGSNPLFTYVTLLSDGG